MQVEDLRVQIQNSQTHALTIHYCNDRIGAVFPGYRILGFHKMKYCSSAQRCLFHSHASKSKKALTGQEP
jgi:hypothetical protein